METKLKLDVACENLRKAMLLGKVIPTNDTIKEKWITLYKMGSVQTRKARDNQNYNR